MNTPSYNRVFLFGLFALLFVHSVFASTGYLTRLPNANNVPCPSGANGCVAGKCPAFGHMDSTLTTQECGSPLNGTTDINNFGVDYRDNSLNWTTVCNIDSDGDGMYNGDELGDPCCVWKNGTTPRYNTDISHPGDATSAPTTRSSCHDNTIAPPIGLASLQLTGTSVRLTWTYAGSSCYCGFRVDIVNVVDSVYFPSAPLATTQTVTGLTPNTPYTMYVRAYNWVGTSPIVTQSTIDFTTPAATVAQPPRNVSAITTKTSMNISWVAPLDDGNSPISKYEIQFDDFYEYSTTAAETTYFVNKLRSGEDYRVRVRSVNGVGQSEWTNKYIFTTQSSASTITNPLIIILMAFLFVILL